MEHTQRGHVHELNARVRELFKKSKIDVDGLLVYNQEDSISIDFDGAYKTYFTYSFERGKRRRTGTFKSYIEAVKSLICDYVPSPKEQDVFEALIDSNRVNAKLCLFCYINSSRYFQKNTEGAIDADYDTEKKMWYLYLFANGERNILGYYSTFERIICAIIEKEVHEEREMRKAVRAIMNKKVFI